MELKLNDFQQKLMDEVVESVVYQMAGKKTTIAFVTAKNGFEITGTSGCVNPDDFNFEIGKHFALVDALTKLGKFEGYHRQDMEYQRSKFTTININVNPKETNLKNIANEIAEGLKRINRKEDK